MKNTLTLLFLSTIFLFSCSTDKEEENRVDENVIVGTWQVTELKLNNDTASDDAKFGKQILDMLTNDGCHIITFTFNEDSSVIAENSVNHLDFNVTSTGLVVPCPTEMDADAGTYTYENEVLTIVDSNQETIMVNVDIDGNSMSLDANELDIPNFNAEGQLVFERK